MSFGNFTFLMGGYRIVTASSGESEFGHTFGGTYKQKGTTRGECNDLHIHLLHRLDLTDPAIPFRVPGIRWFPFYYCFDFRVNEIGYRLISDDELEMFFPDDDPNVTAEESWPADDFPLVFPESRIKLNPYAFDPCDPDDVFEWCGVFGIEKLSIDNQGNVKRRVREDMEAKRLGSPSTDEEYFTALSNPFVQGKPIGSCLNPSCPNRSKSYSLNSIALMSAEPVKGVHIWGEMGDDVELIFQMCPGCQTVRVSNQCT